MRTAKRITTACLTAIMIFQALAPSTEVFAQELDAVMEASVSAARAAGNTARSVQDAVATALQDADQAASDDATMTPGADAGATEGGDGSTNADESQDSTTDGTTGGDASTEGDASQDDAAADEGAADEEQTDDADADAAAQANVRYEYNTAEELGKAGVTSITTGEDGAVTQIVFNNPKDLIKISNTNPTVYQNAAITRTGNTGDAFDLVNTTVTTADGHQLVFSGFGGEGAPFKGLLDMKGSTLVVSHTLYNNVQLSDANKTVTVTWKGTDAQPVIASKIDGNGETLVANVTVANVSADKATLKSPLLGEVDGVLTLEANYLVDAGKTLAVDINSTTDNIGLLANTVKANASFTINKLEGLPLSGTQSIKTTKGRASAGGLIGFCDENANVSLATPVDLSNFTVVGTAASGGFIGKATKLTLRADNKKFTCPANVGDAKSENFAGSENVGGFIGEVSFASSVEFINNDQIDTGKGVTLKGKVSDSSGVGAAIGKLNFADSTTTVSFKGGTFKSAYGNSGGATSFGGLVGMVTGFDNSKPLHIDSVHTEFELNAAPLFTGGLIGWFSRFTGAALEVKGASVNCTKLVQSSKGFGGIAGCFDKGSIVDINGVTVENTGDITKGAGIAAESWGSAIRLSGVTDFSKMNIAENDTVAQLALVRADVPTLVFACGTGSDDVPLDASNDDYWVYNRCSAKRVDDLSGAQNVAWGYGQVIRLDGKKLPKDLIKINMDEHKLKGPSTADWMVNSNNGGWSESNRTLDIRNARDFVCLALTVQFANLWNGVNGFGGTDGSVLLAGVTINLTGNVDLSGTGVEGLGFDSASKLQPFTGTFNGNNHTIALAIGEPYGKRGNNPIESSDTTAGNGKIYRHSRLGLFAAIGGGATVNNLTIDGVMNFDNGLAVDAGSLAATVTGNATLGGVTCSAAIACDDTFGKDVNIGGIAGSVSGAGTVELTNNTQAKALISTGKILKGNTRIGGAIGYVGDAAVTVNASGITVSRSIMAGESATSKKIAQVGGFIGCIVQSTYNAKGGDSQFSC